MKANVVIQNCDVARELEATSRAVITADEGYLREALESVDWERRGPLGRLVRVEPRPRRSSAAARARKGRLSLHRSGRAIVEGSAGPPRTGGGR